MDKRTIKAQIKHVAPRQKKEMPMMPLNFNGTKKGLFNSGKAAWGQADDIRTSFKMKIDP
ncbi:MAG: hypothetical protein AAF985_14450 [Bacteroidota bacterium]